MDISLFPRDMLAQLGINNNDELRVVQNFLRANVATEAFDGASPVRQTQSPRPPHQQQNYHPYHRVPQLAPVIPPPLNLQLHPSVRAGPSVPREVTPAAEPEAGASLPARQPPLATPRPSMPPVEPDIVAGAATRSPPPPSSPLPPPPSSPHLSLVVPQPERAAVEASSYGHAGDGNPNDGDPDLAPDSIPETPPGSDFIPESESDSKSDSDSDYNPVPIGRARVRKQAGRPSKRQRRHLGGGDGAPHRPPVSMPEPVVYVPESPARTSPRPRPVIGMAEVEPAADSPPSEQPVVAIAASPLAPAPDPAPALAPALTPTLPPAPTPAPAPVPCRGTKTFQQAQQENGGNYIFQWPLHLRQGGGRPVVVEGGGREKTSYFILVCDSRKCPTWKRGYFWRHPFVAKPGHGVPAESHFEGHLTPGQMLELFGWNVIDAAQHLDDIERHNATLAKQQAPTPKRPKRQGRD